LAAIWIFALMGTAAPAGAVEVVDDIGRTVRLPASAERVVSLAPHATELLFAVGAGDRLVGTVSHSDYPLEARKIPRVGDYSRLDLERIVSLKPDLVVAWHSGNAAAQVERLRSLGFAVYFSEPRRFEDMAQDLLRLGALTGNRPQARRQAVRLREAVNALVERYAGRPPVTVFYQIWNDPLRTINGDHLINQAIEICGGRNIFADLPSLAPRITRESIIARDPEVIVASGMGEQRPQWLDDWRRWQALTAVKRGNLFFVPPALLQRHGLRLLQGTERLCGLLALARSRRPVDAIAPAP
jgi:iron complex transport system substrate-binding protein